MQKHPRIKNEAHLKFIRSLPCCVCGNDLGVDAAHIRYADVRSAKRAVGVGEKPDDRWTVPLCRRCHTSQHSGNEFGFWNSKNIDPIFTALSLWGVTGDYELGSIIVGDSIEYF